VAANSKQQHAAGLPREEYSLLLAKTVPCSTAHRLFKHGHFRRHTSDFLTEENKVSRVACALEEIDRATLGAAAADGVVRFQDMFDGVDVDEKRFYQTSEKEPHRTISHKNHITKVMFLCAQARPRWDPPPTHNL
jgi:hypothetical protein